MRIRLEDLEQEIKRTSEKSPDELPLARRYGVILGEEVHQGKE